MAGRARMFRLTSPSPAVRVWMLRLAVGQQGYKGRQWSVSQGSGVCLPTRWCSWRRPESPEVPAQTGHCPKRKKMVGRCPSVPFLPRTAAQASRSRVSNCVRAWRKAALSLSADDQRAIPHRSNMLRASREEALQLIFLDCRSDAQLLSCSPSSLRRGIRSSLRSAHLG